MINRIAKLNEFFMLKTNIPGLLSSNVGNVKGTIILINESKETCNMLFEGNIIKKDIPMKSVYINEGFIDTIKQGLKKAKGLADVVIRKFKGLFVPIIDGIKNMAAAYSSPSNWIEMQKQGIIPANVGISAMGEDNGVSDQIDEEVSERGLKEFEDYVYKIIDQYDKNDEITADEAIKNVVNESINQGNKDILNEARGYVNNAFVVSLGNPTVFGRDEKAITDSETLIKLLLNQISSTLLDTNGALVMERTMQEVEDEWNQEDRDFDPDSDEFLKEVQTRIDAQTKKFDKKELNDYDENYKYLNYPTSISEPIIHTGNSKSYIIWGAPGIGKTAAVNEVIRRWNRMQPHRKLNKILVDVGSARAVDLLIPNIENQFMAVHKTSSTSVFKGDLTKNNEGESDAFAHKNTEKFGQYTASWLPVVNTDTCNTLEDRFLMERCINKGIIKVYDKNDNLKTRVSTRTEDDIKVLKGGEDYWGGILFFDEITRISDVGLRTFIMNLVNGHMFNTNVLASNWIIVAASNRIYDVSPDVQASITQIMGETAKNTRFVHVPYALSFNSWFAYAKKKLDPVIVEFFETIPEADREKIYYPTIENGGYLSLINGLSKYTDNGGGDTKKGLVNIADKLEQIRKKLNSENASYVDVNEILKELGILATGNPNKLSSLDVTAIKGANGREWLKLSVDQLSVVRKQIKEVISDWDDIVFPQWDSTNKKFVNPNKITESTKEAKIVTVTIDDILNKTGVVASWKSQELSKQWIKEFIKLNPDIARTDSLWVTNLTNIANELDAIISGLKGEYNKYSKEVFEVDERKYPSFVDSITTAERQIANLMKDVHIESKNTQAIMKALAICSTLVKPMFNVNDFINYYFGKVLIPQNFGLYGDARAHWEDQQSWRALFNKQGFVESLIRTGYFPIVDANGNATNIKNPKDSFEVQQFLAKNYNDVVKKLKSQNTTSIISLSTNNDFNKLLSANRYNIVDTFVCIKDEAYPSKNNSLLSNVIPLFEWKTNIAYPKQIIDLLIERFNIPVPTDEIYDGASKQFDLADAINWGVLWDDDNEFNQYFNTLKKLQTCPEYVLSFALDFQTKTPTNIAMKKARQSLVDALNNNQKDTFQLFLNFLNAFYKAFNELDNEYKKYLSQFYCVNELVKDKKGAVTEINNDIDFNSIANNNKCLFIYSLIPLLKYSNGTPYFDSKYTECLNKDKLAILIAKLNTHIFNFAAETSDGTLKRFENAQNNILTAENIKTSLSNKDLHETADIDKTTIYGNMFWAVLNGDQNGYGFREYLRCVYNISDFNISNLTLNQIKNVCEIILIINQLNKNFDFYKGIINLFTLQCKIYCEAQRIGRQTDSMGSAGLNFSKEFGQIYNIITNYNKDSSDNIGVYYIANTLINHIDIWKSKSAIKDLIPPFYS